MSKSQSTRPQKKRRLSSGDGVQLTRSKYWFEDGNVVLLTENTLFRVHRSILSRHSENFKDIFARPQAAFEENGCVEGCPVVPLSDTAEDISNMISLLYDFDKMLEFGRSLPSGVVRSMLRLGRKYAIPCLEKEALSRLRHDFPTTLEEWDTSEPEDHQIKDANSLHTVLGVISIAHEFRLFTILPAAYAEYLGISFLVASFCHKNAMASDHFFEQDDVPKDICIPVKARECCLIGYAKILNYLKKASTDALCPPMILPSETCSRSGKCKTIKWKAIQELPIWLTEESSGLSILDRWGKRGPEATGGLCSRCQDEAKKLTNEVRSQFWSVLPSFFGLAVWADLKDDF